MTFLPQHQAVKQRLLEALRGLADLAGAAGMKTLRADLVETRVPKLEEERFHLVVLGEFNHGKSTFVNALLGADVLPTGITPTTATINHVVWADRPRAKAVLTGGKEIAVDPKALADWVTVDGSHAAETHYVEVGWPAAFLEDKLTLVDTPGVNDLNEQRAEITYEYVPRADAVLFLLDAGQALKESERAFLASRLLERSRDRMIFVVCKADLLTPEELADVVRYVEDNLGRLVDDPPVFAVSARKHLAGDRAAGRMEPLLQHLARSLTEDRGRVLLDNAAAEGLRAAGYLKQNLGVKRSAFELSLAELTERVEKVRSHLSATKDNLERLHDKIRSEGDAIKARVRLDVEQFAERFQRAIIGEIDKADAHDVKRYLPLYIQDKFKEWAELEGEACAELLERLAEEAITVTNENARAATAAVAERLGPTDARFQVDVDTFRYDVSVYAVGALGTTVFLFVNTLVGGVLTLAAPILAIVLHSRAAAEIKDQAMEKAPEAIRQAAALMRPHFERLVNEFVTRLGDFVTAAGDKLYRGITEVLDQAIAERRARGDAVAPLAAEAEEQIARLSALEEGITQLRADLWK
ncbi:MAG TPA: dynamin family protein [Haliangiales bacterium]|nr:dynamin family protein [Haliangiales bacterium]